MVMPNDFFLSKIFIQNSDLFQHMAEIYLFIGFTCEQKSYYTKQNLVSSSSNEVDRQKADRLLAAAEKVLEMI